MTIVTMLLSVLGQIAISTSYHKEEFTERR